MIIIPVKEGEAIDRALKRFKRKFDKVGTLREIRGRKHFIKKFGFSIVVVYKI